MKKKHYHFIGIGGMGMGPLASLVLAKGGKVSGSDLKDNELTQQLRRQGVKIDIGHNASNVGHPDFVVYSSAIRMTNPEMMESVHRQLPLLKRAQLLAELVNEQYAITIAGAHGKTTTTSMVSCVLQNAGLKPSTAVGGIINGNSNNALLGDGKYFVAEVDESDGTFLYFRPTLSVITNVDFEHVDFYKDWKGILDAYMKFIQHTKPDGRIIACGTDERLRELVQASGQKAFYYGLDSNCDLWAAHIASDGFYTRFECRSKEGLVGNFELNVPGLHNVLNALACISVSLQLNVPLIVIQQSLKEFSGVKRRFQLKGKVDDIMVVDDYGHHPTEVTATLKAARLFNKKRIVTIFQPHRYSRTKFLLNEFVDALCYTDQLILTDIYAASEKPTEGIGIQSLLEPLQARMKERIIFLKKEQILAHLTDFVQSGDLVLFLGAGDVNQYGDELVTILNKKWVMV